MTTAHELGRRGEDLAKHWLTSNGFLILDQNWRWRRSEVDFICSRSEVLHLVEVKTSSSLNFGYPEERVDAKKMNALLRASARYQSEFPRWTRVQFDVLSIILRRESIQYLLIEDVFI